ncbi:VanZ family protein [Streptomyces sp. cmx-4-25]|uniref:VanZ family protein n=1 Tax=unclassified Streptomyces TaxID=2593676 RepID=UPI0039811574
MLLAVCATVCAAVLGVHQARKETRDAREARESVWRAPTAGAGAGGGRIVFGVVALLALVPFLLVTLTHGYGTENRISAVPFREILDASAHSDVDLSDVRAVNLIGNVLLLVPFGAAAAFLWAGRRRVLKTALAGAAFSLIVEVAQYALSLGRVSSVDDVLLNTAGAALGAFLVRRRTRRTRSRRLTLPRHSGARGETGSRGRTGVGGRT